jgi:MinD-like ATPase involved in chromosome partitioning or flagellar assembly
MSLFPSAVPVLVAASGAAWETDALRRLEQPGSGVVLTKRCVDLTDLLATAGTGAATVAVVSPRLPGLDADSVDVLRRAGLGVVVVAGSGDLAEGDDARLRRVGVADVLDDADLTRLVDTVLTAGTPAETDEPVPVVASPLVPTASGRGRAIAVWGPAGAPGRTTVAVGLAAELAAAGHGTFLLDVDPYGGSVAQHLGVLDEVSGLLAAARAANTGRLDAVRLAAGAREVAPDLRVLTGLPRPDRWQEVRPAAYDDLLDQATRLAPFVVLDVGFSLEADPADPFGAGVPHRNLMTLAALDHADEVVVVGAADPVGLSRLARGLVELRSLHPGLRPRVVVNRTRPSLGWSDKEIRGMVEGFVTPLDVHFLPDDRAAADRALMSGRSLVEGGESELRSALAATARALVGDPPDVVRRGRLRRRTAGRAR